MSKKKANESSAGLFYNQYDDAWMRIGDTSQIIKHPSFFNPLLHRTDEDRKSPGKHELMMMSNPSYLALAAKVLLGINLLPEQALILKELWIRPFPMLIVSRGGGKSWLLAVYAMLRLILTPPQEDGSPGCKIVMIGAAFRQSKIIFEYMETLWKNASVFRSVCNNRSGPRRDIDRCTMHVNANWAIAVPVGTGQTIRGLRATIVMVDEFDALSTDVYETVIAGFATVKADPADGVREHYRREALMEDGKWTDEQETVFQAKTGNQSILSGTAGYSFNHFAEYWRRYKAYITSFGNMDSVRKQLGDTFDNEKMKDINPKHYSVMRIPFELLPRGMMDEKVLNRAKATVHSGIFAMEYQAVFSEDSSGFFKRSLIDGCVANEKNINDVNWPNWCSQPFDAMTRGHMNRKYVIAVDPASEDDNLSVTVLELQPFHQRIVYVWTTNRKDFLARKKAGLTNLDDFYGYCARKIRDLAKVFPLAENHPLGSAVGIDAQGGGVGIMEALHDKDKLREGELPWWPIIDPNVKGDYDLESGKHIIEVIQFARADWTSDANHGLRKDFEDRATLFPRFDTATLEMALAEDKFRAQDFKKKFNKELVLYDTLEDAVMEIEELKNELTTIIMSRTGTGVGGRDRWDTPEVKLDNGKKGRLRKDRYSSLLIANMIARQIARAAPPIEYEVIGGFASDIPQGDTHGKTLYSGPDWFTKPMNAGFVGQAVVRHS